LQVDQRGQGQRLCRINLAGHLQDLFKLIHRGNGKMGARDYRD
jgi:hypothetical protein